MSAKKEVQQTIRKLRKQGWRVEMTKGGHYKCFPPDGGPYWIMGSTPRGDGHRHARNELKRMGAKL